jgi:hypothetical protein
MDSGARSEIHEHPETVFHNSDLGSGRGGRRFSQFLSEGSGTRTPWRVRAFALAAEGSDDNEDG